jgi:hypothetical protein
LQKKIFVLAQGNNSVSAYYTQLKGLRDELLSFRPVSNCSCGGSKVLVEHNQQEYIFHFLMGLNEPFANIKGQILLIDPLPPINKVFSLVLQEERQRELYASSLFVHDTAALLTKIDHSPSNSYPKQSQFRKPRPLCSHCGLLGRTIEKCYKLHGYPLGYKPKLRLASAHQVQNTVQSFDSVQISVTQEQCQQLLALLKPYDMSTNSSIQASSSAPPQDHIFSNMAGNIQTFTNASCPFDKRYSVFSCTSFLQIHHTWIIDTGATDHMIRSVTLFASITAVISHKVKLPNGHFAPVTHIGTVQLSEHLILTNVLCVPSFSFNLISASQLLRDIHCCLIFIAGFCFIQNLHTWRTIGMGRRHGGLFHFLQTSKATTPSSHNSSIAFVSSSVKNVNADVWHFV